MALLRGVSSALLFDGDSWNPSPFRPPLFYRELPSQFRSNALAASAQPWYPTGLSPVGQPIYPSPTPRLTPVQSFALPLSNDLSASESSIFSPLSTPVSTVFHCISDHATEKRVYPLHMFLSARKDASHTPQGILEWCIELYLENPSLNVPHHLALSLEGSVTDTASRGRLGAHLKPSRGRPARQIHYKVLSILSRITDEKYNDLLQELLQLPLRQCDNAELEEVVHVFFDKASEEPEFSGLYSKVMKVLCTISPAEAELEPELRQRLLSVRLRELLCRTWDQRLHLNLVVTDDDRVNRTTGEPLEEEELEKKVSRMKRRLIGNVKFFAELISMDIIPRAAITTILSRLVGSYDASDPQKLEECAFELFNKFMKSLCSQLVKDESELMGHYFFLAKHIQQTHPRCRVRFMMEELEKFRLQNHFPIAHPTSPSSFGKSRSWSALAESFGDGLSSSSASFGEKSLKWRSGSYSISKPSLSGVHTASGSPTHGVVPLLQSVDASASSSFQHPSWSAGFTNVLLRHVMVNDEEGLPGFSEYNLEEKKCCIFEFFNVVFSTDLPVLQKVPQLLAYLVPHYLKDITLNCIIISYMRDEAPRQCEASPTALEKISQLVQYYAVPSVLSSVPYASQFYYINYFNLILLKMSHSGCSMESFLELSYPSHSQLVNTFPPSTDVIFTLSAASLATFHFLYALMPKSGGGGKGRYEAAPEMLRALKGKCPPLNTAIELVVYELIVRRGKGWEDSCVRVMVECATANWNNVTRLMSVMNAIDALYCCTAVHSTRGGRLLTSPIAAVVISRVLKQLNNPVYEAGAVIELLLHCNLFPFKYDSPREMSVKDMFCQQFQWLDQQGAFLHKKESLKLLQCLGIHDKTAFAVHCLSLSTRNGMSVTQAVELITK